MFIDDSLFDFIANIFNSLVGDGVTADLDVGGDSFDVGTEAPNGGPNQDPDLAEPAAKYPPHSYD